MTTLDWIAAGVALLVVIDLTVIALGYCAVSNRKRRST